MAELSFGNDSVSVKRHAKDYAPSYKLVVQFRGEDEENWSEAEMSFISILGADAPDSRQEVTMDKIQQALDALEDSVSWDIDELRNVEVREVVSIRATPLDERKDL